MHDLPTPALLLDRPTMRANIGRMNAAVHRHASVVLRPHLKTGKSVEVARAMTEGWPGAVTVSTLKEAEVFADAGWRDILYAVGMVPAKLAQARALAAQGTTLTVVVDSVDAAEAVATAGLRALIEIDTDGARAGMKPEDAGTLSAVAAALGGALAGVMTHCGGSYAAKRPDELPGYAEQERAGAVRAAEVLRAAGFPVETVSVGSTPTALFAEQLDGVTEVRAGVYVFQDLVMAGLGVCLVDHIALSVLASVIGHQPDRGRLLVDAGWMALSRDLGRGDQGYGQVAGAPDLIVVAANQEHGIVAHRRGHPLDPSHWPIGARLRILPNHACATAAQHDRYHVLDGESVTAEWSRFGGW